MPLRHQLHRTGFLNIVIALFLFGTSLAGCDCEEITEQGERGTRVIGQRFNVEILHTSTQNIPPTLECGQEYSFQVVAQEVNANCETFQNWDVLYDEAVRQGDARIAQIACHDNCPVRNPYIIHQRAGCDEFGAPAVVIQYVVRCIAEEAPVEEGLPFKDSNAFPDPFVPFDDTLSGVTQLPLFQEKIQSSLYPDPDATECPYTFYFAVDYQETVPNCNVADYRPFIKKAETDAATLWNALGCPPGCQKQPLVEIYMRWRCEAQADGTSKVIIVSEWSVECIVPE